MRVLLLLVIVSVFAGCARDPYRPGVPVRGSVGARALDTVRFGEPIALPDTDYVLVPFAVEIDRSKLPKSARPVPMRTTSWQDQQTSAMAQADDVYPAVANAMRRAHMRMASVYLPRYQNWITWNNLILFNKRTGESRLLLDRRAMITWLIHPGKLSTNIPEVADALQPYQWPKDLLLLGLIERDTSGDGFLDGSDATVAYLLPLEEPRLVQIAPEETDLIDVRLEPGEQFRLYLTVRVDSNRDGLFDDLDENRYFMIDGLEMGRPLVPEALRDEALRIITGGGR